MDKKKRLLEIIEEIQEMYPHLDRLMITDLEDPDTLIITSEARMKEISGELGLDYDSIEQLLEEDEDPLQLALLEFDDDDNNGNGGMLQ